MKDISKIQKRKEVNYGVKSMLTPIIKDVDMNKRIVTGLYNTCNFFDSDYDVILVGASTKSISERGPNSQATAKIKHLLFHDWTQLPGKIQVLEEKQVTVANRSMTGIYFETKMADTTIGDDTIINYQEEIYDNHSIGFRFLDGEWIDSEADEWDAMLGKLINPEAAEAAGFAYLWKEIMLYEGSTVAFGANSLTPYLGVKDLKNKDAMLLKVNQRINLLNKQLKNGTQTDETLQAFEMQTLQLKQIIHELFHKEPFEKPTRKSGRNAKDDQGGMISCSGCGLNFDCTDMTPNDDGAYACPDCNVLCMYGTGKSDEGKFSIKSFTNLLKIS